MNRLVKAAHAVFADNGEEGRRKYVLARMNEILEHLRSPSLLAGGSEAG